MIDGQAMLRRIKAQHEMPEDSQVFVLSSPTSNAVSERARTIEWIATTDDVDCDGDVVVPSGGDLGENSYWRRNNRRVFMDHDYTVDHHIGVGRSENPYPSVTHQRGWKITAAIFKGMRSRYADDVWAIALQAGIPCSSAFLVRKIRPPNAGDPAWYKSAKQIISAWEMVELSATASPCNVSCDGRVLRLAEDTKRLGVIDDVLSKSANGKALARMLGIATKTQASGAEINKPRLTLARPRLSH